MHAGGVFENEYEAELSVELPRIIEAVNSRPGLLPPGVRLVFDVEFFSAPDSFAATRIGIQSPLFYSSHTHLSAANHVIDII